MVALLGVSHQAAAAAVNQLATLSASNGGLDPSLPEFAAVAADLHVSPKQRLQAPDATKAGDDRASTGTKANSASRAGAADLLSGAAVIDSLAQQRAVDHNRAASAGQQLFQDCRRERIRSAIGSIPRRRRLTRVTAQQLAAAIDTIKKTR